MPMLYKTIKRRVFAVIQPSGSHGKAATVFDWTIITLIFVNVLLVILDTFSGIPGSVRRVFSAVEVVTIVIFTAEYFLRLWTADFLYPDAGRVKARLRYALSFMAVIDLLSILPFYLPFIFPIDLRALRMVRLLRLFRLMKINRYTNSLSSVGWVIRRKASQLLSSLFVVIVLIVIASILMYGLENEAQPDVFQNAFSGLWWTIATLTTVGYGDIYPITTLGKLLGEVIALLGIGLVAVPTGIISAGFMEDITQDKDEDKKEKHFCPYCGHDLRE